MELTDEQLNAVDLFKRSRSLKISAFAGTGKTSTLVALAKSTNNHGLYLAFNKSIASEAASRFPRSVDCRTTHSIAFRAVPSAYRGNSAKLTQALHGNHLVELLGLEELAVDKVVLKPRSLGFLAAKTVQRFCQTGDEQVLARHVPLVGKLQQLTKGHQEEFREYLSKLATHVWEMMLEPSSAAPLGHDGYLKLWSLSRPRLNYDFLLLDEAQDTNEAVLSVLRQQDGHLTLVGDRHQQIYEWRGAVNAMASVDTDAEAVLTRSFRFGDTVAGAATSILQLLGEARAVVGNPAKLSRIAASGDTNAVLCRTNAGVVSVVVDALSEHRKPHVVGGVSELLRMLEDVSRLRGAIPAECPEFFGFKDWAEVQDFAGSDEGESLRSFVNLVGNFGEAVLVDKLLAVAREEAESDLIVSTGHKAKGREWSSVKLHSDFEPRMSKEERPRPVLNEEEARLLYVAVTRAKELLVVPPMLASKWNAQLQIPETPATVPVAAPVIVKLPKPLPTLPSFASVVRRSSVDASSSQPDKNSASALGSGDLLPTTKADGIDAVSVRTSTMAPPPGAPLPAGRVARIFTIFRGKR